jgi:hypothetical protein
MTCKGAANTNGAYLASMIDGGGWTTTCAIVGEVTEALEDVIGQLRGGGVNQLLPCLNNYASFNIFTRNSMIITIMQRNKQRHIQHQSHI